MGAGPRPDLFRPDLAWVATTLTRRPLTLTDSCQLRHRPDLPGRRPAARWWRNLAENPRPRWGSRTGRPRAFSGDGQSSPSPSPGALRRTGSHRDSVRLIDGRELRALVDRPTTIIAYHLTDFPSSPTRFRFEGGDGPCQDHHWHAGRPSGSVDTDDVPSCSSRGPGNVTGYGEFLFWDWGVAHDDQRDPDFVLNKPQCAGASILVTGPDFGVARWRACPWGLQDWGSFRASSLRRSLTSSTPTAQSCSPGDPHRQ